MDSSLATQAKPSSLTSTTAVADVSTARAAERHSLDCFLNSLLREWDAPIWETAPATPADRTLAIPLGDRRWLRIPARRYSRLGRHDFGRPYTLSEGERTREVDFATAIDLVLAALVARFDADEKAVAKFRARVAQSETIVREALHFARESLDALYSPATDFLRAEQSLVIGHSFHPTPKSRDEFDAADLAAYSPEFGGRFPLVWWLVHPETLHRASAAAFDRSEWLAEIARTEVADAEGLARGLNEGFFPFPVHPWQRSRLLARADIRAALESGRIRELGPGRGDWHPTSSLRSLFRADAPFMLKFSLSVRLTNSVRHLLVHEVARGLQLHDVLATPRGREFFARHPAFRVLREPAYLALRDAAGTPLPETIVVARENPYGADTSDTAVLATLCQAAPFGEGESLAGRLAREYARAAEIDGREARRRWLAAYLDVVVRPLFDAQANYGVVLGAHQQNLILGFRNGLPVSAAFRDCQGTGYTELGYATFAKEVPTISRANGNVVTERMGNALFLYYLFVNSTFNVIAALAETGETTEDELLAQVRRFLVAFRAAGVRDASALDTLLENPTLLHKGNFLCSIRGLNENTTADPLAIYVPIENPFFSGRTPS